VRRDSAAPRSHGRRVHLNLTGVDHPGIVREVSSALARHGVSIDELNTEVRPGSMTGEPLFTAQAIVILPNRAKHCRGWLHWRTARRLNGEIPGAILTPVQIWSFMARRLNRRA